MLRRTLECVPSGRLLLLVALIVMVTALAEPHAAPSAEATFPRENGKVITGSASPSGDDATTIDLDTYRADNSEAIVTGPVLEDGEAYRITVTGTYSVWHVSQWDEGTCVGTSEPMPMFPSPVVENGPVSADAAWRLGRPEGTCRTTGAAPSGGGEGYPRDNDNFRISVDGGDEFIVTGRDAVNFGIGPNPAHTYEYYVAGEGENSVFQLLDTLTFDNYGILKITIEEAHVAGVEITQGIQRNQGVVGLQTDLQGDGQPPVPIVAGKPAALRVYMAEVDETSLFHVSATGAASGNRIVQLTADCTPEERRTQENGCESVDFFFTPPQGDWSVTVTVREQVDGPVVEEHEFNLTSVGTVPLVVEPVTVCDDIVNEGLGLWGCGSLFNFAQLLPFLRSVYPGQVIVAGQSASIYVDTDEIPEDDADWWEVIGDYTRALWAAESGLDNVHFYGVVRPQANAGSAGGVASVLANAAAGKMSVSRNAINGGSQETADELIAHLIGHNAGLEHVPSTAGCYGTPSEVDPGWPGRVRPSAASQLGRGVAGDPTPPGPEVDEVGFDVSGGNAIPETYADVMSLCTARWVSPYTYNRLVEAYLPNAAAASLSTGDFWLISGTIDESAGGAEFDPVFELETEGDTGPGEGLYRIDVLDGSDQLLFSRSFMVDAQFIEDTGQQPEPDDDVVRFAELVPVQGGAEKIVVYAGNDEVGDIHFDGEVPLVELTSGLSTVSGGTTSTFSWNVADADSAEHLFWVQLSRDGGGTWKTIAPQYTSDSLTIDPAVVGGGDDVMLRVLASDGANTGTAISTPFSLPTQAPQGSIASPDNESAFGLGDVVWLQGAVIDVEDGFLDGNAVRWSSSRDGNLGTGASLPIYDLTTGAHTITMAATDSDGNEVTVSITITVADASLTEGALSGDVDCNGVVNSVDGLKILQTAAGLPVQQTQPCPQIGAGDPPFGDVNCDGAVGAADALFLLRFVAALPVNLPPGCPQIGARIRRRRRLVVELVDGCGGRVFTGAG